MMVRMIIASIIAIRGSGRPRQGAGRACRVVDSSAEVTTPEGGGGGGLVMPLCSGCCRCRQSLQSLEIGPSPAACSPAGGGGGGGAPEPGPASAVGLPSASFRTAAGGLRTSFTDAMMSRQAPTALLSSAVWSTAGSSFANLAASVSAASKSP